MQTQTAEVPKGLAGGMMMEMKAPSNATKGGLTSGQAFQAPVPMPAGSDAAVQEGTVIGVVQPAQQAVLAAPTAVQVDKMLQATPKVVSVQGGGLVQQAPQVQVVNIGGQANHQAPQPYIPAGTTTATPNIFRAFKGGDLRMAPPTTRRSPDLTLSRARGCGTSTNLRTPDLTLSKARGCGASGCGPSRETCVTKPRILGGF